MKISADFTVIPDDFAKAAAPEYFNGGVPVVSFPFYIDDVDPEARYLHWEFVDPDSIPVRGATPRPPSSWAAALTRR